MIGKNQIFNLKDKKKSVFSVITSTLVQLLLSVILVLSTASVHPSDAQTPDNINLSNDPGRSADPRIATSGNNVYVVWSDTTTGNGDIYFRASPDNGTTFGGKKNLSNNTGLSSGPKIATSGKSNVYVVWSDTTTGNGDIYLKLSTTNGVNFTAKRNLSSNNAGISISPQIATSGKSNVYVVWSDTTTGNGDIYFRASKDNGTKFTAKRNLSSNNAGISISPQIATSGNNVYVVWSDNTPGNSDTFFRASTNNGANFTGNRTLSRDPGSSYDPKIATSGKSNVYVVWEDNTVGKNISKSFYILFRASTNAGANFTAKEYLSRNVGQLADFSQITAAGDNLYVVWSDISSYQGVYQVFLRAVIDNGTTISDPIKISNSAGSSISPQVATSGDYIYVIWQDNTIGNGDIYFRRGVG